MNKKKLLVSFSGGQTSAYMTKWCIDNLSNQYEIEVVFANTGKEREETLQFVNECDKRWNFNTVWVEAVVAPEKGKGRITENGYSVTIALSRIRILYL